MQANQLPAARGWQWFLGGLRLWQTAPGSIGLAAMLAFLISAIVGSIPWIGSLFICLAGPFMNVLLLRVCHAAATGRRLAPRELMNALTIDSPQRLKGLLLLGVVTFVGLMLSKALTTLIAGDALGQIATMSTAAGAAASAPAATPPLSASVPLATPVSLPGNVMLALLVNLAGVFVLSVVMWMAPALTAFAGVPPFKALFFSVVLCWRNKGPFLVFGFSLAAMTIPLSLLMMLGGLGQTVAIMVLFGVFMPACFASNYLSVTDIFGPLPMAPSSRGSRDA